MTDAGKKVFYPLVGYLGFACLCCATLTAAPQQEVPDALKPWEAWATWDDVNRDSPSAYNNPDDRISFWPSRLNLIAGQDNGTWEITVNVFAKTWLPLPGSIDHWPLNVFANGQPIAVLQRNGGPAVQLKTGRHELTGEFKWDRVPQKISIPKTIGLLSLEVEGQPIPLPSWDSNGQVWLKRDRSDEVEKNLLGVQVYRVLEDGIPIWLRTEIELTVSGKSREEELGWVLPEGWKLATVTSPLPVAIDEQGQMKAQVRSGKWIVTLHAFCTEDIREIQFGADAQPITNIELIGFRSKPNFRLLELAGLQAVDVSQTTFPTKWRSLPVFQWDTSSKFQLVEKTRGMGIQRPEGLRINRQIWLDGNGQTAIYRDSVTGQMQQIWRLDSAEGQQLGSVRIDGKGQLITANPVTGAPGVEIRTRNLNLDAIGEISNVDAIPGTGWQTDADSLGMMFNLPPGWRVLALFGADEVRGDWLTAWSLLDLFLLLIFALAVGRIWGIPAGVIALLAFGLAYHEAGAPRLTWLFLLIPVALLKVVPAGTAQKWIKFWKHLALVLLLINLVPFLAYQIQTALYPQLERPGINYQPRDMFALLDFTYRRSASIADWGFEEQLGQSSSDTLIAGKKSRFDSTNLLYDPKSRIQTGPAQPEWHWNRVYCSWDGPVTANQEIRPVLISRFQHRWLTVARIALLTLLAAILFGALKIPRLFGRRRAAVVAMLGLICLSPNQLNAQEFPDANMLKILRERLLQPSDAFPNAAEIPATSLKLEGNEITMEVEIHAAIEVAVPLPGRVPTWSPVSVSVDSKPAELVCRKAGYLWTVVPPGVHKISVRTLLPDVTEWEWTFLLKPRTVSIEATGWKVTGVRSNGVPEQQVFFSRERKIVDGAATYDRKDFNVIVAVDRHLETGLTWQVRNEVTRLSPEGRAVSVKVPLLPGESVLTSEAIVEDGFIEVRLGEDQQNFSWTSELPIGQDLQIIAPDTDEWVERWHLVTSPVWNVGFTGLAPVYEAQQQNLIPVWHPWPTEEVALAFNQPDALPGETITVQRVNHETRLGSRQRQSDLQVELECSLGGDLIVQLDSSAEVASVKVSGQSIPVRRDEDDLIIPVQPGRQIVEIAWRTNQTLQRVVRGETIELPIKTANITSVVQIPESRWVLWTSGPTQGPAVQFWVILIFAILGAIVLGSIPISPLSRFEWVLLAIGLTQVHIAAAMIVVGWLFLLAWRGRINPESSRRWVFNLRQIGLVLLTLVALGILIVVVGAGLLGNPEMFIVGNDSSHFWLRWYQPAAGSILPEPTVISVSVWFYRLLMLFWALWLASALLRWLIKGWKQFSHGGGWKHRPILADVPEDVEPEIET